MRTNIGITFSELRENIRFNLMVRKQRYRNRCSHWHRWFAWYPVRLVTGEIVWLEAVQRRGDRWFAYGFDNWDWEYRDY